MAWRPFTPLAAVCVVGSFAALFPASARAQQPGIPLGDLVSVRSFEHACSQSMIDDGTDAKCRQGIAMALGKEPVFEEVRGPKGTSVTAKLGPPDVAKAGWLGEEACANRHWQSCMLYVMLLERGDVVPRDPPHAVALARFACAGHYTLACNDLQERGVTAVPDAKLPPRPSWVKEPADEPAPRVPITPAPPPAAANPPTPVPQRTAEVTEPLNPEDPTETEPLQRCIGGNARDCYAVARLYDTTRAAGTDSARAIYYYQRACNGGVQLACDRIGVQMPAGVRRAAAAGRASATIIMWVVLAAVVGGIAVVSIAVYRRASGSASSAPHVRPVAVRPPAGAKRPGA